MLELSYAFYFQETVLIRTPSALKINNGDFLGLVVPNCTVNVLQRQPHPLTVKQIIFHKGVAKRGNILTCTWKDRNENIYYNNIIPKNKTKINTTHDIFYT